MMKLLQYTSILVFLTISFISTACADTLYRENFSFCGDATTSHNANTVSGWTALAAGKIEGKVGNLKVSTTGSPNIQTAIASLPTGPFEGNLLWTKSVTSKNRSGLLMFTDEYSLAVGDLRWVSFEQRSGIFSRDEENNLKIAGARVALLINNRWYISDQEFKPTVKNQWQSFQAPLAALTFGSSPFYPGVGPRAPQDSGRSLPSSRIVGFGLFFPSVNARIRIDNFALYDGLGSGKETSIDTSLLSCSVSSTFGGSYDTNRRCINGGGDRTIKMKRHYRDQVYPAQNTKRLAYLRNKIALILGLSFGQTLHQITSLLVQNFQKRSDGSYELTLVGGSVQQLSRINGRLIENYVKIGKLGGDQSGPLLRPTVSGGRLASVGICGTALRSNLQNRASKLRIRKYLQFPIRS